MENNSSPEAREELAKQNIAYAARLAVYFHRKHPYLDSAELLSTAISVGLRETLEKFDPLRGVPFKLYLRNTISYILRNVRRDFLSRQGYRLVSLDADSNTEKQSLLDKIEDSSPLPDSTSQDIHIWVRGLVNSLPKEKRKIITACFGLNGTSKKSQKQIAAEKGTTLAGVNDIKRRALQDLRKKINKEQIRTHL